MKIATGPPDDGDSEDAALGLWAGVLPVVTTFGEPVADPVLPADIDLPAHIADRAGRVLTGETVQA